MKILMVTPNFPPAVGGVQNYAAAVAKELAAGSSRFEVIAERLPQSADFDRRQPYRVHRWPNPGDNYALSAIPIIKYRLHRNRPDFVFATHWSAAYAAHMAGAKKVACAAHGKELLIDPLKEFPLLGKAYGSIREHALLNADVLFPVSHFTGDLLRQAGVDERKTSVVPNGVDPDHYRPMNASTIRTRHDAENKTIVLSVTRFVRRKGIDSLIATWQKIESELGENAEYWIVGSGPDEARLRQLASPTPTIRFLGRVSYDELPLYYNAADIFALAPRQEGADVEGFGLVFLEASACGKAVLGTRSGGVVDAIIANETGILCEPDDIDELAEGLRVLITDPIRRRQLGEAGRRFAAEDAAWKNRGRAMLKTMRSFV